MPDKFAPEKHLVITWPNCGSNQIELAKIIHEKFEVLRVISGEWTESNAELNYSRFLSTKLIWESRNYFAQRNRKISDLHSARLAT